MSDEDLFELLEVGQGLLDVHSEDGNDSSVEFVGKNLVPDIPPGAELPTQPFAAVESPKSHHSSGSGRERATSDLSLDATTISDVGSPRWRASSILSPKGTIRGSIVGGSQDVLIGARRTKETLQLNEEVASLKAENAELKVAMKNLMRKEAKATAALEATAQRYMSLSKKNNKEADAAVTQMVRKLKNIVWMLFVLLTAFVCRSRNCFGHIR
jgi:hypothetical protein